MNSPNQGETIQEVPPRSAQQNVFFTETGKEQGWEKEGAVKIQSRNARQEFLGTADKSQKKARRFLSPAGLLEAGP
jgi:hypothetical protein